MDKRLVYVLMGLVVAVLILTIAFVLSNGSEVKDNSFNITFVENSKYPKTKYLNTNIVCSDLGNNRTSFFFSSSYRIENFFSCIDKHGEVHIYQYETDNETFWIGNKTWTMSEDGGYLI